MLSPHRGPSLRCVTWARQAASLSLSLVAMLSRGLLGPVLGWPREPAKHTTALAAPFPPPAGAVLSSGMVGARVGQMILLRRCPRVKEWVASQGLIRTQGAGQSCLALEVGELQSGGPWQPARPHVSWARLGEQQAGAALKPSPPRASFHLHRPQSGSGAHPTPLRPQRALPLASVVPK